jgi:hypothetical protein
VIPHQGRHRGDKVRGADLTPPHCAFIELASPRHQVSSQAGRKLTCSMNKSQNEDLLINNSRTAVSFNSGTIRPLVGKVRRDRAARWAAASVAHALMRAAPRLLSALVGRCYRPSTSAETSGHAPWRATEWRFSTVAPSRLSSIHCKAEARSTAGSPPGLAAVQTTILDSMFKILFLCGALCAALEAQPHKADGSNLSAAQQRNIEKLKTDLEAIKGKSQVRIAQLTNDFYNAAVSDTQTLLKASGVSCADATSGHAARRHSKETRTQIR